MSGITLERASAQLALWLEADAAVAEGKEYWMNGQRLILEDANLITDKINYWARIESQLMRRAQGGPSTSVMLPRVR